jgi:2-desacetyl-2-hydroxyethyl bacteriochlorophyllide A dehydrogenase
MRAAVFEGEGRLSLTERPIPSIREPGEILLEVEACGVCGTDLQILATPPGHPATPGTILGHEFVGHIVETGPSVTQVSVGDRVIIDADPKCGVCDPCRMGRPADCEGVVAIGIFRDGALASHVVAPAGAAHPISGEVPAALAALAEPLACVVNAGRKAALRPGESAVILGAGAIGCLFLALFRASGAGTVTVVEPNPERAAVAHAMGADAVVAPDDLAGELAALMPAGAEVVVDAVGSLFGTAVEVVARGGRIVLFGMNANVRPPIHQVEITERSLTVMGSYISNFTYPEAIRLLESGRLDLEPMVSAVMPLSRVAEGLDRLRSGSATKVVITP